MSRRRQLMKFNAHSSFMSQLRTAKGRDHYFDKEYWTIQFYLHLFFMVTFS